MPDVSDMELLRDYGRQGSEVAFAELVRRHINLVYSAALRHVGIAAHAEEITQSVFIILARKAASLRPDTVLDAWLYETTRLTALSFLRGERRRQFREQEAYMQSTLPEPTDASVWNQLAPLLDQAMARLGKKDREAVVLRFFKEKNLEEVAVALKITEAAAQSRVHRAVERLRTFFLKRGIDSTAATIAAIISANTVHVAPVALAKTVTAIALAKGVATGGSTLILVKGALNLMAWTKMKMATFVGAGLLLAAGTATVVMRNQNTGLGAVFADMISQGFAESAAFPKLTNNVPVGGDLKVRGLLSWVQGDVTNYPGKSTQQVSYSIVIGSGEGFAGKDDRDLGKSYIVHYGSRNAIVTLIARPNFSTAEKVFVVSTYYDGEKLLEQTVTLQWLSKENAWGVLKLSGPAPDDIRP